MIDVLADSFDWTNYIIGAAPAKAEGGFVRSTDLGAYRSEFALPALHVEMCMVQQSDHSTLPSLS
jgi:hypothetical protein